MEKTKVLHKGQQLNLPVYHFKFGYFFGSNFDYVIIDGHRYIVDTLGRSKDAPLATVMALTPHGRGKEQWYALLEQERKQKGTRLYAIHSVVLVEATDRDEAMNQVARLMIPAVYWMRDHDHQEPVDMDRMFPNVDKSSTDDVQQMLYEYLRGIAEDSSIVPEDSITFTSSLPGFPTHMQEDVIMDRCLVRLSYGWVLADMEGNYIYVDCHPQAKDGLLIEAYTLDESQIRHW